MDDLALFDALLAALNETIDRLALSDQRTALLSVLDPVTGSSRLWAGTAVADALAQRLLGKEERG
jgi:hypothetical protein